MAKDVRTNPETGARQIWFEGRWVDMPFDLLADGSLIDHSQNQVNENTESTQLDGDGQPIEIDTTQFDLAGSEPAEHPMDGEVGAARVDPNVVRDEVARSAPGLGLDRPEPPPQPTPQAIGTDDQGRQFESQAQPSRSEEDQSSEVLERILDVQLQILDQLQQGVRITG